MEVCRHTADQDTGLFETETITMAMGLLTAILSGALEVSYSLNLSCQSTK